MLRKTNEVSLTTNFAERDIIRCAKVTRVPFFPRRLERVALSPGFQRFVDTRAALQFVGLQKLQDGAAKRDWQSRQQRSTGETACFSVLLDLKFATRFSCLRNSGNRREYQAYQSAMHLASEHRAMYRAANLQKSRDSIRQQIARLYQLDL